MTVIPAEEEEEGRQVLRLTEENSFDLDSEFTFRRILNIREKAQVCVTDCH
jgi:hypothetical protein